MAAHPEETLANIHDVAGDALRVVAEYDSDGYHVHHTRNDVEPKKGQISDEVHEHLVIQGLEKEYREELFDAGGMQCSMQRFEDLTAFHFLDDQLSGLFVSIDSHVDVPLATFVETCQAQL